MARASPVVSLTWPAGTGDSLTLFNEDNTLTLTGVETVVGDSGADTITLTDTAAVNVNLGAGTDTLEPGKWRQCPDHQQRRNPERRHRC